LLRCSLENKLFDVLDLDAFGGDALPALPLALGCLRFGGTLHLCATDFILGGGGGGGVLCDAFLHPGPCAPENGLRALLGAVARAAAVRGMVIVPLFSLCPPGPSWRLAVRIERGVFRASDALGFTLHCPGCGASSVLAWRALGCAGCACGETQRVSGPLWLGPLHDEAELSALLALAEELGWADTLPEGSFAPPTRSLRALLQQLQGECDRRLPPHYYHLEDLSRRGRAACTPPRDLLLAALRRRGFAAARCHCDARSVRTDASYCELLDVCRTL